MTLPDGRILGWTQSGDAHGAPLLWFHGSPGSRLDAAPGGPYSDALTAAGVRLICFDRPGYGLSSSHPSRTLLTTADDAAALADALDLHRFAIAGWSGGGPMALATAARLGSRATGVALFASIAPATLADPTDLAEAELFRLAQHDPAALAQQLGGLAQLMRDDPLGAAWQMLGEHLAEAALTAVSDPAYAAAMATSLSESARQDLRGYQQDLAALAAPCPLTLDRCTNRSSSSTDAPTASSRSATDRRLQPPCPTRHSRQPTTATCRSSPTSPPSPAPCSAHRDHAPHGPALANRH